MNQSTKNKLGMNKTILTAVFAIFIAQGLSAQEDIVRIVKTFEPTISEAKKPDFRPQIVDTVHVQPSFTYKIVPLQLQTSFTPEAINPAKLLPEVTHPAYGNYVKLGFGSNLSPLADVRLHGKMLKSWMWNVNGFHQSAYAGFKMNEQEYFPHFSESKLNLGARKYLKKHLLSIHSGIELYGTPFYGFDFDNALISPFLEDSLTRQRFILQQNSATLKSTAHSTNHFNSNFKIDHYSLWDKFDAAEHEISMEWGLEGEVKENPLEIETRLEYTNRTTQLDTLNEFLFELAPAIYRERDEWKFKLGFKFFTAISPDENAEIFIYPDIEFDFAMAEDFLHGYFGLNGEFTPGKLKPLAMENPFIYSGTPISPKRVSLHVFTGFKGLITNELKYHVRASYQQIKNQHFYQSMLMPDNTNQFTLLYDSTDLFRADGEISYDYKEKFSTGIKARYEHYFSQSNEDHAWLIPAFSAGLFANYNFQEKIEIGTEFQFLSGRKAKIGDPATPAIFTVLDVPMAFDWNLEMEYRYNRKVSAFVSFENLLGNKYYLYNYYPVEGFRVYLGIIYSF
jgi:hypothetical protein